MSRKKEKIQKKKLRKEVFDILFMEAHLKTIFYDLAFLSSEAFSEIIEYLQHSFNLVKDI
jgi:hypothetical protein